MNINIINALADKSRLRILSALGRGELCACVLPDLVRKTQPTVSSHLKVLHKAGLVGMRKDGTKRLYSLSPRGKKVIDQIGRW
ncbi:MAG: metalloregulator ArsR/SmtB family transcription factor [Candidatus Micrarchaeota archaeon]